MITKPTALAPSPQPRPAPTALALPPEPVVQEGQNWTPIGGQIWKPIDRSSRAFDPECELQLGLKEAGAAMLWIMRRTGEGGIHFGASVGTAQLLI